MQIYWVTFTSVLLFIWAYSRFIFFWPMSILRYGERNSTIFSDGYFRWMEHNLKTLMQLWYPSTQYIMGNALYGLQRWKETWTDLRRSSTWQCRTTSEWSGTFFPMKIGRWFQQVFLRLEIFSILYKAGLQLENKLLLTSKYEVPLTNWAAGQLVYQPTSRQNM